MLVSHSLRKPHGEMTVVEHIGELRRRILWTLAVFVVGLCAGLLLARPIIELLKHTGPAGAIQWNVFSPWDSIRIFMNFSFVVSLVFTFPVALYQLWAFIKPGLEPDERQVSLAYVPVASLLYLIGLAFGYFVVFRMAFSFSSLLTGMLGLTETYGISQYFSFMFNILIPVSFMFEIPVVVMFLTELRLLTPARLIRMRKIAYMILVVLSTLVTPPDAISALAVFVPVLLLYELSVLLSRVVYRRIGDEEVGDVFGK